jgi:hypothetical protein
MSSGSANEYHAQTHSSQKSLSGNPANGQSFDGCHFHYQHSGVATDSTLMLAAII